MKFNYAKAGAISYLLWGILHVFASLSLLGVIYGEGITPFLKELGSLRADIAPELNENTVVTPLAASYCFSLVWMGIISSIIAIKMNWKNSITGYWFNLALIGFADVGLIVFMLFPGYMPLSEGFIGPLLWLMGWLFSSIAIIKKQ